MIQIKNQDQIAAMRTAGHLLEQILLEVMAEVRVGVTTLSLSDHANRLIRANGATPTFLGYNGFPAALCTSVNDVVVHGIPDDRTLTEGDIVGLDIGLSYKGWQADMARTVIIGTPTKADQDLVGTAERCFWAALPLCKAGYRVGDIASAVQTLAEASGYSVVRALCGHGIGRSMHEDPEVPNFGTPGHGTRLKAGMTIAIEPMLNAGDWDVKINGWDTRTVDGAKSAHYENTVAITDGLPEVLTCTRGFAM